MSETNPPPVAPVEGHYKLLRGGLCLSPAFDRPAPNLRWYDDGMAYDPTGDDYPDLDVIATISPADMQAVASGELERLRAALQNIRALAAKRQHEGGPDGNFKAIEEFAVYGLEGKNP